MTIAVGDKLPEATLTELMKEGPKPRTTDEIFGGRKVATKIVISVLCLISVLVAIFLPSDIFSRVLFAWGALGAVFGPVAILRLAKVRLNPKAILPSMVTGFVLTIIFYLQPNSVGDILERLVPFLISFILLYATHLKSINVTQKENP